MPGRHSDDPAQRGADQRQPRLPAPGAARLLPDARSARTKGRPIEHPIKTIAALLPRSTSTLNAKQQRVGVLQLQPLAQGERDVRRRDLRHVGQRHRRRPGAHQRRSTRTGSRRCRRSKLNELHFTYSRETRPRTAVESNLPADTGMGFAPDVPLRQPVLPAAERRRADLAHADQGQLVARRGHAHDQGRRRVDAHAERSGVPRLLHRPLPVRQRRRASCATRRRRRPADSARRRSAARTASYVTAPTACPAGTTTDRRTAAVLPAGRGRARARRPTRPAPRRSPTTSSRCSCRTSGRSAPEPHAELRPALGRAAHAGDGRPADDGVRARSSNDPAFPSDGTIPGPVEDVAAARRRRVGRQRQRQVGAARQRRHLLARQNMLSQVGSVTTNGLQQQTHLRQHRQPRRLRRADAGVAGRPHADAGAPRVSSRCSRGVRVFDTRLREPAHLFVQRRLRAGARARLGRLRRLHLGRGTQPDAVPQLQPQRPVLLRCRAGHRQHVRLQRRRGARSSTR